MCKFNHELNNCKLRSLNAYSDKKTHSWIVQYGGNFSSQGTPQRWSSSRASNHGTSCAPPCIFAHKSLSSSKIFPQREEVIIFVMSGRKLHITSKMCKRFAMIGGVGEIGFALPTDLFELSGGTLNLRTHIQSLTSQLIVTGDSKCNSCNVFRATTEYII